MLTPAVVSLIQTNETVTSGLAKDFTQTVGYIAAKLYPDPNFISKTLSRLQISKDHSKTGDGEEPTPEELEEAVKCGKFLKRPSDLFLKIYVAVLRTLERDPLAGVVSPPLIGSSGVMPLTIISIIPDIMQHYADCIVRAEKEVFLATNFWVASKSSKIITDAILELSKRAQARGSKIVFKLMYDRGSPKQAVENHILVSPEEWTAEEVQLPAPEEIPGIQMEVINFHRPIVGTFHSKYMVIDRKIALLNSNNIQDRCNMEMMTHLEGPIVDSFYDMALLSWDKALNPPLPCLLSPPVPQTTFLFGKDNEYVKIKNLDGLDQIHPPSQAIQPSTSVTPVVNGADSEQTRTTTEIPSSDQPKIDRIVAITKHLSAPSTPSTLSSVSLDIIDINLSDVSSTDADLQPDTKGTLETVDNMEPFHPFIVHAPHDSFPIAMVNRKPHGTPGHGDTVNPQDASWIAALRFAKRRVFIQTPTFNAKPIVEAVMDAVRRGIDCVLYLDLGFNDAGELLPYQGGTNEDVTESMYKDLDDEHKKFLKVYWYTGKDMIQPINAKEQKRNCHVKIMTVDDTIGIQGNGNQDSQSWFHSQEINILIDEPNICKEWEAGIRSNQNTHLYGQLALDGKWKDKDGNLLPGAGGANTGPFKTLKGIQGAIKRVQGKGGF